MKHRLGIVIRGFLCARTRPNRWKCREALECGDLSPLSAGDLSPSNAVATESQVNHRKPLAICRAALRGAALPTRRQSGQSGDKSPHSKGVRRSPVAWRVRIAVILACAFAGSVQADTLRLLVQPGYLPSIPVLVRVEALNPDGSKNRDLWDAEAFLSSDVPGVNLSTNRVALKNGLGSSLVTFTGGSDFNLTASLGDLQATRPVTDLSAAPVTAVGGTLPASSVTWSGVVRVTNDVTVPVGGTLTIESGTLVLMNGVSSGTTAPDIFVNGTIQSRGTENEPITITCASATQRWGQIRHSSAQPSLYRYTSITRAGRATGEGHTGTGPVIRSSNSQITFEHCSLTDHAEPSGSPGKIMYATGSTLTFDDCLLARARMGPEVASSAITCTNTWIMEMRGPDDSDGIYIHTQSSGQIALLSGCVIAGGDDDGLDTLGSDVTVENCIIRDWTNPGEDAKGISGFHGAITVHRSIIANCFVGISAKSSGPHARVNILNSTVTGITRGIAASYKANAEAGNILFQVTNSIVRSVDAVYTDFSATNFSIGYCNLSESWPGEGNFIADPLFVDAVTNFHLESISPCIDAGDPASPLDPDGTRVDVGAYAFQQDLPGTKVGGTLISNTTWTLDGSPYIVTNDVTVSTNVTLTIEAGVLVQLRSNLSVVTEAGGLIEVAGTSALPVLFRSADGTNIWGRLGAIGTNASLTLRHADLAQGQTVVLNGASGWFEFSYFHDYFAQPILLSEQAASVLVRGCHFQNFYETLFRFGVTVIEDSLFENITGDGIDFDYASPGSIIRRCTLRHGPVINADAVDLGSSSVGVLVEDCLMYDFPFDKGVSIGEASSNIVVRGCVMFGVDMGVAVKDSSEAVIVNNTIAHSVNGLRLYEKNPGQGGGHAVAWNNIIWDNTNSIVLLNGSTITVDFSDAAGAGVYPGTSNLNANPLFLNSTLHDYRLAAGSPAIGTGTNGSTMGAIFPVGSYLVDTDGDTLPDTWEQTYGLDFNNATDAPLDTDQDGLSNLQEFWAGTNPADAASYLRIIAAPLPGQDALLLSFEAISNRSYTVESRASLDTGDWTNLLTIPPAPTNRFIQTTNASDNTSSFYRLTVLAQ
ncbi:MAG: right-handed parallel beta-helix repeat-containing protein [Verrucomicrobia bacterium]|nr:right-handed parallel beta-helix repeat-containing protein [Verrucomicrobiota bacterium]